MKMMYVTTPGRQGRSGRLASERGIALMISLLTLLVMSAIGMGMMLMSSVDTTVTSNYRDEQTAYYAAKAGIEEVRDRLRSAATNSLSASLPSALPGSTGGILYVTNPASGETVQPWLTADAYTDNEICNEVTCTNGLPASGSSWYSSQSASSTYAASPVLTWKWVRVNLKTNKSIYGSSRTVSVDGSSSANQICWNGSNEVASAGGCSGSNYPIYELTALAVSASGARRMIQAELTKTQIGIVLPAALVLDGTTASFGTPHSNNFGISGVDPAANANPPGGCDASHSINPSVGDSTAADKTTVDNNMFRTGNLSGSNGAAPPVATTGTITDQVLSAGQLNGVQTVGQLQTLVQQITSVADNVIDPNNPPSPMPSMVNQITVVNGDSSWCSGSGILLVTGTLTCSGNNSWDGLIYVIGKGVFQGNGGGNGAFTGAIMVANLYDSNGNALASSSAPGMATFNFNGGGGNGITYNSCSIANARTGASMPYQLIANHEIVK